MSRKVTMIVDLQFGSTGKGLMAGHWAEQNHPDVVVNCNMPNAGHTYIDSKGQKMIFKVLPNGLVSPKLKYVLIGPGSVFSMERLQQEIEQALDLGYLGGAELVIHPQAMVLRDSHRQTEQASLSGISSTMQGSAAAVIEKMMRTAKASTAENVAKGLYDIEESSEPIEVPNWFGSAIAKDGEWETILLEADKILAEGSQGHSLGINAGFYPYCTSRDCSPARFLSDMGIPVGMLGRVIGTARTYPIRVGNTPDGYSGDHYADQTETSFEEIGQPDEFTTVTGRKRRIFTFSMQQLREAAFWCCPDEIFLNFVNYLDDGQAVVDLTNQIQDGLGVPVSYFGTGPAFGDVLRDVRFVGAKLTQDRVRAEQDNALAERLDGALETGLGE
jgi:adenylosuccinate synthase